MSDIHDLGAALADCAANQVLWNLEARGIEFDLMPLCAERAMPVMAYSPIGQGGRLLGHAALLRVARRHGVEAAAAALAFVLSGCGVTAIPKAAKLHHLRRNRAAPGLALPAEDMAELAEAFPPPRRRRRLEML